MKTAYISIIAIVLVSSLMFLGFFSVAQAQAQLTPLYRWFFSNNVDNVDHFYTTDPTGGIAPGSGYVYEGIACYIATTQISGTTPLYCWWNSNIVDHFYTTDPTGGIAPGSGYVYECVVGYVATTQISGTTPFYRWWNSETGDHFYTTDPTGEAAPTSEPGPYVYEGIACYVWTGLSPFAYSGPVGWETYPISKVRVLLPYIVLLAAIAVGASLLVLRRRRAQS